MLVQVDNEGALYFRDGAYDQDYHPDAVQAYRAFLETKYRSADAALPLGLAGRRRCALRHRRSAQALRRARRRHLARHVDWAEFHEELLVDGDRADGARRSSTRGSTACRRRTTCRSARARRRSTPPA